MGSPGSFDLSPVPAAIATTAMPIVVAEYIPGAEAEDQFKVFPNVRCLRIDYREGPEPPIARFQYYMDDALQASLNWPSQFEQLWPIDAQNPYVVWNDQRLVVLTMGPSTGNGQPPQPIVLFDGFAQIPQVDLSAQRQEVTFVAQGVPIRLWDQPIVGRVQRDASDVDTTDGSSDVAVHIPARFNPSDTSIGSQGGYIGNCVPSSSYTEVEDSDDTYPVFLDSLVVERSDDGLDTSFWFVSDALAYLISVEPSPEDDGGNAFVTYPTLSSLKDLLSCYSPPEGQPLNPDDAEPTDIKIRDYDASNKAVPEAMSDLLAYCGFVMTFAISTQSTDTTNPGTPETVLKFIRKDALSTQAPKILYLAANGATSLDLSANNTTALHLARDANTIVNQWTVESALQQVEITVYLAPGFTPSSGDAASPSQFDSSKLTDATADQRRMYRWFVADECGDGHYNMLTSTWVTDKALDLSPVFPDDDNGEFTYVTRYRPGSRTLISKGPDGKPLKAVLEIAAGFYSEDPELEDPSGSSGWCTIPHGWRLLDDRLGIEVTADKPDAWTTGARRHPTARTPRSRKSRPSPGPRPRPRRPHFCCA